MKKTINNIIILLLLGTVMTGCAGDTIAQETEEIPLVESSADSPQLIEVTYGDVENMTMYQGEVTPYMQVLQFPEEGAFGEYKVELGEQVKQGQVIATTESKYDEEIKELRKKIAQLETDYNNQVTNYNLQIHTNNWKVGQRREWIENMDPEMEGFEDICIEFELLISQGEKTKVLKRQYMDLTQKEIDYQKACLADLERKDATNVITAPADGTVTYLADLKVGDAVNVKSYPVAIANLNEKYIQCDYMTVSEAENLATVYAVYDRKEIPLTYHPYDSSELQQKSAKGEGLYSFFEFDASGMNIAYGDMATVIAVKEQRKNVLVVPTLSVKRDGNRCFVYADVEGERRAVDIEVGVSDKIYTEVLSGLEKGDYIYVSN